MVAQKAAKVAGTGIGAAVGGFFTNPAVLILAALGIGLFVFRDKISQFFQDAISGFKLPDINLPDINFPDFPDFDFPDFPDFPNPFEDFNLCSLFGIGCNGDQQEEEIETSPEVAAAPDCVCGTNIVQDASGAITVNCKACDTPPPFSDAAIFAEDFPEPFEELPPPPSIVVDPALDIPPDVEFEGGGPSFIGGSIGQTPVTTLFQVLDLFSGFSASQAANFLFQFSGISPSEALELEQFQQFI